MDYLVFIGLVLYIYWFVSDMARLDIVVGFIMDSVICLDYYQYGRFIVGYFEVLGHVLVVIWFIAGIGYSV